jgi:hypothetical protein
MIYVKSNVERKIIALSNRKLIRVAAHLNENTEFIMIENGIYNGIQNGFYHLTMVICNLLFGRFQIAFLKFEIIYKLFLFTKLNLSYICYIFFS